MARRVIDRLPTYSAAAEIASAVPVAARNVIPRGAVDFRILELLSARLCHELSGPIAAIANGVELLAEEEAVPASSEASFLREAVLLVSGSTRRARRRLEFYRFAYGSAGLGAGAGTPPWQLAAGLFEATRIACTYGEGLRELPEAWQKLACNLLPVGADALPRGGRVELTEFPLSLEAVGDGADLSPDAQAALTLAMPVAELTSRTVQAYFAGLLAQSLDCRMIATAEAGRVRLAAIADRQPARGAQGP